MGAACLGIYFFSIQTFAEAVKYQPELSHLSIAAVWSAFKEDSVI